MQMGSLGFSLNGVGENLKVLEVGPLNKISPSPKPDFVFESTKNGGQQSSFKRRISTQKSKNIDKVLEKIAQSFVKWQCPQLEEENGVTPFYIVSYELQKLRGLINELSEGRILLKNEIIDKNWFCNIKEPGARFILMSRDGKQMRRVWVPPRSLTIYLSDVTSSHLLFLNDTGTSSISPKGSQTFTISKTKKKRRDTIGESVQ